MEDFNIALLAKQGWRIMKNPSSLFARFFKAKYFRHSDFLRAKSYQISSYAWRSLMLAQDLLKKRTKWVVGNRTEIKVWEDNWINTNPASPARGIGASTHPQLRVCDLMKT